MHVTRFACVVLYSETRSSEAHYRGSSQQNEKRFKMSPAPSQSIITGNSQVQAINEPPPKTWDDYERGCLMTYHGGHSDQIAIEAYQHGMRTVFNLLRAEFPDAIAIRIGNDKEVRALHNTLRMCHQVMRELNEDKKSSTNWTNCRCMTTAAFCALNDCGGYTRFIGQDGKGKKDDSRTRRRL